MSVVGTVENLKSEFKNISFKLSVFKKNKSNSNKSSNAQDGRVTLEPMQKIALSKTQINKSNEDQIIVLLLIYDEDNKICSGFYRRHRLQIYMKNHLTSEV